MVEGTFAWGSGEAGYRVEDCLACSLLFDSDVAAMNDFGYLGSDATGVVIRSSRFARNGVGVAIASFPEENAPPTQAALVFDNVIRDDNVTTIPAAGVSQTYGAPFGTGVWVWGSSNVVVRGNTVAKHARFAYVQRFARGA